MYKWAVMWKWCPPPRIVDCFIVLGRVVWFLLCLKIKLLNESTREVVDLGYMVYY